MAKSSIVPTESIEQRIFLIRGQKVMLDVDLARLYQVKTKVLNQAVVSHFVILSEAKDLEDQAAEILRSTPFRSG